jgi:hypothetical protein
MDAVRAAEAFFREDPLRILAVADRLRGPDRSVESTVEGVSMGRTIPPGSRIRFDLADRDRYAVGDVLAFVAAGKVVVHRLVYRGRRGAARDQLLTRGDAALVPDQPLTTDRILGPVTAILRADAWIPLDRPARRSGPAGLIAAAALAAVAGALQVSPRAAAALVRLFHRGRPVHAACLRMAGGAADA